MAKRTDIGFGQRVKLEWLRHAQKAVAQEIPLKEIENQVRRLKDPIHPEKDATRKSWVNVNRTWVTPPDWATPLRDDLIHYLNDHLNDHRDEKAFFVANWAAAIAAHPFFGHTAEIVGRLGRLKDEIQVEEVKRRVSEKYGDRDFVIRAARYNVSSMLEWGAIEEKGTKGTYYIQPTTISDSRLAGLLCEAAIQCRNSPIPWEGAFNQPQLFPFIFTIDITEAINSNPRLQVSSHGMSDNIVEII